ncbi:MAG: cytochrome c5 family protein [Gammaproteobacteria bacterium]
MSHSDSSFLRTLVIVIAVLTTFLLASIFVARALTGNSPDAITNDPMYQAALMVRIKPVAQVRVGSVGSTAGADAVVSGDKIYKSACFACHGTGAAGAPKLGDKAAWKARIAQGMSTLVSHALKGFKGMPAKGGRADLSDEAVKAAIKHMVDSSQ